MERLATFAAVNRAAAAILMTTATAQFHLILPQQGRQGDALLDGCKILAVVRFGNRNRNGVRVVLDAIAVVDKSPRRLRRGESIQSKQLTLR